MKVFIVSVAMGSSVFKAEFDSPFEALKAVSNMNDALSFDIDMDRVLKKFTGLMNGTSASIGNGIWNVRIKEDE